MHTRPSSIRFLLSFFLPVLTAADAGDAAAQGLTNFTRGPFLQSATPTNILIAWRTAVPASSFVEYGVGTNIDLIVTNADSTTNHLAQLAGLTPDTAYTYRIGNATEIASLVSSNIAFRSLKTAGSLRFQVVGDSYANPRLLAPVMCAAGGDFVAQTGDVVWSGNNDSEFDPAFFSGYQPNAQSTPFFFAIGNHDLGPEATQGVVWQNALYLPTNSVDGSELFYSFDHGDAHLVVLADPEYPATAPFPAPATPGTPQWTWLTNDLANSSKRWKIIFQHNPMASCGGYAQFNDAFVPLAGQFGLDLVFASHDHDLQRFAPTNGLHHVVSGGGGAWFYSFTAVLPAFAQFWSAPHFLNVSITNDTLTIEAVGPDGRVFDGMTIQKSPPSRLIYESSWHTPTIEAAPADDGDGNINGQTFDFIGAPILPRAGQFSNLGRVHVNNDATNLYLGFAQAMTYPDNNVFLFIESPRRPGVRSMRALGNGLVDPDGEGADGLDCLENLSFTNFAPSVACLLGDEYADGPFRSFARPGLALNVGQGVYRLDASFSDVSGARLQQFNRSPQAIPQPIGSTGIAHEQSADFVELTIPFSELGGLQPGDVIRLGAVVGGGGFDAVAQTRQIDTSLLGHSLTGSGLNDVVLEGLGVRLAFDPAVPALVLISPEPGNQFRLIWTAMVDQSYDVEYSSTLTNFTRLDANGLPLTATSTRASCVVTPPPGNAGFFRIRRLP